MTNGARYSRNRRNRVQLKADARALFTRLELDAVLTDDQLAAVDDMRARLAPGGKPETAAHDLTAAAAELVELMEEALATHIYCAENGERVPANDRHAASIVRVRAALGLPASSIELAPVWRFTCPYTNRHGEADDYQEEITADTPGEALDIGVRHARDYLGLTGTINAAVVLIAGEVEA